MCTAPLPALLAWTCKERIEERDLMLEEWAALMVAGDPAEHASPAPAPASLSPDAPASAE
jgi:hypothetical protein